MKFSSLITMMFNLAISFLTMSNLPWFMDLTFQVPMQYCSLQHQISLSSSDTSTTELQFQLWPSCFILSGAISSCSPLFHSSIMNTFQSRGGLIFWGHIFLPFKHFMEFSWLVYWSGSPFPAPVDSILSELSTMTQLSWVALHGMADRFIELHKPLHHDKAVNHEGEI